jgi:hypothetical protein
MKLTEKYSTLTLESMEGMEIEQIDDLVSQIADDRAQVEMSLELLQSTGGVSIDLANQFKDYLPADMALESFTTQPTNTNYEMTQEALSTTLKVIIAAGVIAGLGTLIWLMMRASGKGQATPNAKAVDNLNKVTGGKEEAGKAAKEALAMNTAAYHASVEKVKKTTDEVVERLKGYGLNNLAWESLAHVSVDSTVGVYSLASKVYSKLTIDLDKDYKEILKPAVEAALKMKEGDESDISIKKAWAASAEFMGRSNNPAIAEMAEFVRYFKLQQEIPLTDKTNPLHTMMHIRDWAKSPASMVGSALEDFIQAIRVGERTGERLKVRVPDNSKLVKDFDDVTKLAKLIEADEKRLKATEGVPEHTNNILTRYIDMTKEKVKVADWLLEMVDIEVAAFNKLVNVLGKETVDALKEQMEIFEVFAMSPEVTPETRTKMREIVARLRKDISK